ncbi:TetR/AcrR family transcriptional regulator [Paucihalobacter ruber]|uniref:TetR/AcrR family transcriptional regulator n=1 Tax=Paucihalobacter ruber TaxID=2567861 RepID=A0A506PER8_9FLAO|nr:TetR/AcrR family transcriptional regulator [Paucihalobacter ruber]TPV31988.1 TetR/AcrR family transcriptional regulator [Paucihalobacter ruber]
MINPTRKEEIIKIAGKLFKQKGYSAVTMRDLAQEMGIKAASLYNHINSKQEILELILIQIAQEFTSGMQNILISDNTNVEKLKSVVLLHVKLASENPDGMAVLNNDWMHLENKRGYYLQLRKQYEDNLKTIITKGIEHNEIKNMNPDVVMFSLLSTLRYLYVWIPKKEDIDINNLTSQLVEVLIGGINK